MNNSEKIVDGKLVLQCRNGDKKAFSLLVKRWHQKFCKQAYWYTKDKDLAKDIAQESWIIIFRKLDTIKDPNSFGSWALSILNRKAIDALRKEKRIDTKSHSYHENPQVENDAIENNKNVDNCNNNIDTDSSRIIMNSIKKLPENQQVVLRLFYVEEYSVVEISSILKVSKGTVKSRLFYAREKLKSHLNLPKGKTIK